MKNISSSNNDHHIHPLRLLEYRINNKHSTSELHRKSPLHFRSLDSSEEKQHARLLNTSSLSIENTSTLPMLSRNPSTNSLLNGFDERENSNVQLLLSSPSPILTEDKITTPLTKKPHNSKNISFSLNQGRQDLEEEGFSPRRYYLSTLAKDHNKSRSLGLIKAKVNSIRRLSIPEDNSDDTKTKKKNSTDSVASIINEEDKELVNIVGGKKTEVENAKAKYSRKTDSPTKYSSRRLQELITQTSEISPTERVKQNLTSRISFENHKPPLLDKLESFISRELHLLNKELEELTPRHLRGDVNINARLARTEIFKECFKIYIDNSKIYAPILSTILKEFYDTIILLKDNLDSNQKINPHQEYDNNNQFIEEQKELHLELKSYKETNVVLEQTIEEMKKEEEKLLSKIEELRQDIKWLKNRLYKGLPTTSTKEQQTDDPDTIMQEILINMVTREEYDSVLEKKNDLELELEQVKAHLQQEKRVTKLLKDKLKLKER
ncbi:hypothetical protein ABK040_002373 [Willaertia magna]